MRVERKEERDEGHRMGHKNMLNIVPVLYSVFYSYCRYYNILNEQDIDFSLGLQENYIFQWTFAENFKKLNIFI